MPRHHAPDDYEDDPNEPDESDADTDDGDESAETIDCPHCGREVYEFAEHCPKCGKYLSAEDTPRTSHPRWVIAVTIILLIALTLGGFMYW